MGRKSTTTPQIAKILEVKRETADVQTYLFELQNQNGRFKFQPGQFNMIGIPGLGEAPISFSSLPIKGNQFMHTIRCVGNVTMALCPLRRGDTVFIRGPFGNGWSLTKKTNQDILVIGGGIGMAPLRAVIYHLLENRSKFCKLYILYGARTPEDKLFKDEWENWREKENVEVLLTVDEVPPGIKWDGHRGVVTLLFDKLDLDFSEAIGLTCGPEIMMRFVARGLMLRGLPASKIFVFMERRMKCGLGHCGHCQIGAKFVCKDGPVFKYSDIKRFADTLL